MAPRGRQGAVILTALGCIAAVVDAGLGTAVGSLPFRLPGNMVYIKVHKVGGSTLAGVLRRVCKRHGMTGCLSAFGAYDIGSGARPFKAHLHAGHGAFNQAMRYVVQHRFPNAFAITMLREPASRALSQYYHFRVSRAGERPTAQAKIEALTDSIAYEYNYIGGKLFGSVNATLDQYDFVGLSHRFDDSLVALQLQLGLSTDDMVYIKAKVADGSGARDDWGFRMAHHPHLADEDESVQTYVARRYRQANAVDYDLVAEAERRLDERISRAQPAFAAARAAFDVHQAAANRACSDGVARALSCKPTAESGTNPAAAVLAWENWAHKHPELARVCLLHDEGCGHACLDALALSRGDDGLANISAVQNSYQYAHGC